MIHREALKAGEKIKINIDGAERSFLIDGLEGEGASCLVYHVTDESGLRMLLKEFYPIQESERIMRKDTMLVFQKELSGSEKFRRMQEHFKRGYATMLEILNTDATRNYTVDLRGFAEYPDGRMYVLMSLDYGRSLEKEKVLEESEELREILRIIRMAAEAVRAYHRAGWLHLDIKPENILYLKDIRRVLMFDFDTVTKKGEILKNTYPIRGTFRYAAPELLYAMRDGSALYLGQLSGKTDLYALAAILLERITGISGREWILSEETAGNGFAVNGNGLLKGLEPSLARKMQRFFRKSLSGRPTDRYDDDEFIEKLQEMENLADPNILTLSGSEITVEEFMGREKELEWLSNTLQESKKAVLYGMGGVGKSILARRYAQENRKDYDVVIIGTYRGSLKQLLEEIYRTHVTRLRRSGDSLQESDFRNEKSIRTEEMQEILREICKRMRVLLIVDSFDVKTDDFGKDFADIGWNIIYTSRCRLEGFGKIKELGSLDSYRLFCMYYRRRGRKKEFSEEEKKLIEKMCYRFDGHALTVMLLAKQYAMSEELIGLEEMEEIISRGIEDDEESITYIKDDSVWEKSIYAVLHSIFNLAFDENRGFINETEKEILRNMTLLSMEADAKEVLQMLKLPLYGNKGVLCRIVDKGWLQEDICYVGIEERKIYGMHPVIREVLLDEMDFNMENCGEMVEYLLQKAEEMKKSFVFRKVSGMRIFTETAIRHLKCEDEIRARLYDCCGVMSGEENLADRAVECFGEERKLLEQGRIPMRQDKLLELKVDSIFWGNGHKEKEWQRDEIEMLEKVADREGYHVACLGCGYHNEKAGDSEKAFQYYGRVFRYYMRAAENGNAVAQNNVGFCYDAGYGVEKNEKKAFTWFVKAAEQGYTYAQNNVGFCYDAGYGVEKNEKKAFTWFVKATEQGYTYAQNNVGLYYAKGIGVEKDEKQAFAWFMKAAEQGDAAAQNNVGLCYAVGYGVEKNEKQAFAWLMKAAEQGNRYAQNNVGLCYADGVAVEKDEKQAFVWYLKAAEQGDANAQYNVGVCYNEGIGVEKDEKQAFAWFMKAAEQGDADAQYNVGVCYDEGNGVEKDEKQAFAWYLKAAEQGDAAAQNNVGLCYAVGDGVEKDEETAFAWFMKAAALGVKKDEKQAFVWYLKAAERGDIVAQYFVGVCYAKGDGVEKDEKQAFVWYLKAAEQGDADAQYNVGVFYAKGMGVEKDEKQAFAWYMKAAEQGLEAAKSCVAECYMEGIGVEKNVDKAREWQMDEE